MNELIPITYQNDRPAVSARELHEFLKVDTPLSKWFGRMCEYGFTENSDYIVLDKNVQNPAGGRPATDYAMSLDMAKELCMIQRTERGKQARQYFINKFFWKVKANDHSFHCSRAAGRQSPSKGCPYQKRQEHDIHAR